MLEEKFIEANMKDLKHILEASLLDNAISEASLLDIDGTLNVSNEHLEIKKFLEENYNIIGNAYEISDKPNADGKYEVIAHKGVDVKNKYIKSLTNDLFVWAKTDLSFVCRECYDLTTLEGAPREVGRHFRCGACSSLISLKGAPKKVGLTFDCSYCKQLESLEGCPEEVGESFYCDGCVKIKTLKDGPKKVGWTYACSGTSIKTLEGVPEHIEGLFLASGLKKLTSLKGGPKTVNGSFCIVECPNLMSLDYAPKTVKGEFNCSNDVKKPKKKFTKADVKKVCNVEAEIIV
jgi:hypothetical protein